MARWQILLLAEAVRSPFNAFALRWNDAAGTRNGRRSSGRVEAA
jgi:hypothetical protein